MNRKNRKQLTMLFEGFLIGVMLILIVLTGTMIEHVRRQMEDNAAEAVKDIFQKSENLINSDILSDLNNVKRFGQYIAWEDKNKAKATLQAFLQEYDYSFAVYLSREGVGYDSDGNLCTKDSLPFEEIVLETGEATYSPVYLDEDKVCQTVIQMPIKNNGYMKGAFYVGVPMERYSSNTIARTFRSEGYFYLMDLYSQNAVSAAFSTGDSGVSVVGLRDLMQSAGFDEKEQKRLVEQMDAREEFSIRGMIYNEEYYLYFIPVAENSEWYLCGMIPSRVIQTESNNVLSIITGIIEMLVVISVLAITAVIYFLLRRRNMERRQAVEREMQNATYDALSEKSDVVVCLFDCSFHHMEQVFRNSSRILGRESSQYLNNLDPLREICDLASPILFQRLMDNRIEEDEIYHLQMEHAKTHQTIEIRFTIKANVTIGGQKKYMFYWEDVTQNIRIQESLRTAAQAAQQASRAKSEFLSNMSHEIRTPMNAIVGMVEIMDRNVDDPVRIRDSIRKIKLSTMHLLNIINDILDLSRIESGKVAIKDEPFCLSDLIDNVSGIIRTQAEAKQHIFEIHIHDLWHDSLYGDWMRLNQILINILNNSVKYTRNGGKIDLEVMETPAQQTGYVNLCFLIRDNGIGMSQDFIKRLGTPFEQEMGELHIQEGGTGLGLSIVFNIVAMMGGSISVESELDKGTAIAVRVDLKRSDTVEEPQESLSGMRVFIADDDPLVCEDVTAVFHAAGVFTDSALNGKDALEKIKKAHQSGMDFDAVIIDWVLPGMDGLTLTKAIREQVSRELPVIFVSSYDWSEIMEEAQNAGIEHFIEKPLFYKRLYSAVLSVKSGRPSHQGGKEKQESSLQVSDLHVLLAEDNDINREIAVEYLKIGSITADTAVNGQEALDMFLEAPPGTYDAVLMDLQMPVMDGLTACRRIRQSGHPQAGTIPIIAMTANAFEDDVQKCLKAGMNAHLAKPLNLNQLFQVLERHMQHREKEEKM